jgi:hypothetical protein
MTKVLERLNSKAGEAVRRQASSSVSSLSRIMSHPGKRGELHIQVTRESAARVASDASAAKSQKVKR